MAKKAMISKERREALQAARRKPGFNPPVGSPPSNPTPENALEAGPPARKAHAKAVWKPPAHPPKREAVPTERRTKANPQSADLRRVATPPAIKPAIIANPVQQRMEITQIPAPDELTAIWDDEVMAAFDKLTERQKTFITVYIREGNASAAYRAAYNPLASVHLSSICGHSTLASAGLRPIVERLCDQKAAMFLLGTKTLVEMAEATKPEWVQDENDQWENVGDVPDWTHRAKAIEGLARIHGLNAPTETLNKNLNANLTFIELPMKKPAP